MSIREGKLNNVQDGISRHLGSREIQETKVGTVLPDTLYYWHSGIICSTFGAGEKMPLFYLMCWDEINIDIKEYSKDRNCFWDIFELYTDRAVENVQDGISRPLGSWEIQKIEVGKVFAGYPVVLALRIIFLGAPSNIFWFTLGKPS